MKLYLDDDSVASLLVRLLTEAGHDVQTPIDLGLDGDEDAVHFTNAIQNGRVVLTGNRRDFEFLHFLVLESGGHHPGILTVLRENNPIRDMTPRGITTAIRNLVAAEIEIRDEIFALNQWR